MYLYLWYQEKYSIMTLHEAIIKLLQLRGRSMTTIEIANELNKLGWYTKNDGSKITDFQIHGRTQNYPQFFKRNSTQVSLINITPESTLVPLMSDANPNKKVIMKDHLITETDDIDKKIKYLMDENNFHLVGHLNGITPDGPGIYCIRIQNIDKMPAPFNEYLKKRGHNILYIGIASISLQKRLFEQELNAIGHGTFFRGLGAILGFLPSSGSLINKTNKQNFRFTSADQHTIIEWIQKSLLINWVLQNEDLKSLETKLISTYRPLVNMNKNPNRIQHISELRAKCRIIANTEDK